MSGALKSDIAARGAREHAELAVARRDGTAALEACDMFADLFSAGYRLFPLAEATALAPKPVRMQARYEGACAACGAPVAEGDTVDTGPLTCSGCDERECTPEACGASSWRRAPGGEL